VGIDGSAYGADDAETGLAVDGRVVAGTVATNQVLGEARVTDAQREEVITWLRHASSDGLISIDEFSDRVERAYVASRGHELVSLTSDLPVRPAPPDPQPLIEWTVGVLGNHKRGGPWRPAPRTRSVALVGSCLLDLSDVTVVHDIEIHAVAVLGGVEVVVPDGVHAELGGFSFAGTKNYRVRSQALPDGAPTVRIRANAVFGGVTVRSKIPKVP
jgi:hypothetical protein